jgi:hypothetical protein
MSLDAPRNISCDWENCPSHYRSHIQGSDMITVLWAGAIKRFHSTDCLALWAGSYPIGYVSTGKEVSTQ